MDIEAVRTVVTVAETGQFEEAAVELRITQQAVSKRVASLERALAVALFVRTARGARLTLDGQAFLPHAREVLRAVEGRPPPYVPVSGRCAWTYSTGASPRPLPCAASTSPTPGRPARGSQRRACPGRPAATVRRTGPPLAAAKSLTPANVVGHRIWIPGIKQDTEWAAYYDELTEAFDLRIDAVGPDFGTEALMDSIADSTALATLVGTRDRYVWPATHDLRRIPVEGPTPVYPHSFLHRTANPHPILVALRRHLIEARPTPPADAWAPSWAGS